mmetsp:Transcript_46034/g.127959  ORF Transcript_46034/g.127959 Transcript_46034/m.127959 type:complete len:107 (-) Transcript_46034:2521-2841(-)
MEAPDSADMGGGGSGENPMIELEHAVGFSASCGEICYHPNGKKYICAAGASLVVCDFADPHDQVFFRGHDGPVVSGGLALATRTRTRTQLTQQPNQPSNQATNCQP